jgi:hypothetical protein
MQEMGAKYILPMHHSTFKLSREPVTEPISRLRNIAGDDSFRIALTTPGETWRFSEQLAMESRDAEGSRNFAA